MQKDLKIGMISGLGLIIAALLYISTRPSLNTRTRVLKANQFDLNQPLVSKSDAEYTKDSYDFTNELQNSEQELRSSYKQRNSKATYTQTPQTRSYSYTPPQRIKTRKFHIVRRGETLSGIARRYYGSAIQWPIIYNANRNTLKAPERIIPGTKLIIPD